MRSDLKPKYAKDVKIPKSERTYCQRAVIGRRWVAALGFYLGDPEVLLHITVVANGKDGSPDITCQQATLLTQGDLTIDCIIDWMNQYLEQDADILRYRLKHELWMDPLKFKVKPIV